MGTDSGYKQWVQTAGTDSGYRQWVQAVGTDSGYKQWVQTAGTDSGYRQWVKAEGTDRGYRQWVQTVGTDSGYIQWVQTVGTDSGYRQRVHTMARDGCRIVAWQYLESIANVTLNSSRVLNHILANTVFNIVRDSTTVPACPNQGSCKSYGRCQRRDTRNLSLLSHCFDNPSPRPHRRWRGKSSRTRT